MSRAKGTKDMLFRILLAAIIVHFKDKEIAWKYSQLKKCFWIKKIFLLCKKTFLLYVLTMSPTCFRVNPLYSCLNIKELLVRSRREIWSLSDCNWTRTHNHLAQPLASSAKCSSVRLWTKWLWARVQLQSLKNFLVPKNKILQKCFFGIQITYIVTLV